MAAMPMENVELSGVTAADLWAGRDRWPHVAKWFVTTLIAPGQFGLFFPLAAAGLAGGRVGRAAVAAAGVYLALLTLPFLVTRLPLDSHLNSTVARFGAQVVPLGCVGLAAAIGRRLGRGPAHAP